ncbi:MAG: SBBP repeat-containing protein [Polyangiaceae bacterium]
MTLAYRHRIALFAPAALLVALAACDGGSEETTTQGTGGSAGDAGSGGTTASNTGGDGGLFETSSNTNMTTTTMTTVDPSAPCESSEATSPSTLWAKKAGAANVQATLGIAADGQGNVVVSGNFLGSIDFGTGALTSAGQNDAFVAKLDANGTAVWAKRYGDAQYHQYAQHLAVDGQGNILVTGHFRGTINFGGNALNDVYNFFEDVFIAKLDSGGNHVWSKRYGDINNEESQSIAVDAQGNVLAIGSFQKSINFGGGALIAEDDGYNVYIAKLNALGDQQWAKSLGDTANEQKGLGVAADKDGNVYIVGYHRGMIDFGPAGAFTAEANGQNAYVAKLSPAGTFLWARSWKASEAAAVDVAVDSSGSPFITGNFKGPVSFGGKEFDAGVANDVFLVKLDKDGGHVWSRAFGTKNAADEVTSVELSGDKPVLLGAFTNKIDFGGGGLTSAGGYDVFLAKLDKEGCQIHASVFGGPMLQRGETLAVDPTGNILFGGSFTDTVDFGLGALTATETDAYFAKAKP